jgi:hypothetical protein
VSQSSLESEYFERNVGDNKDITKIKQMQPVDPYKRSAFDQMPPSSFIPPSFK